jgi:molybdenum cofactor cytidylyltransferase
MMAYADIAVALLAAGQSVRFGSDKLLAEIDGEPLGLKVANTLMNLGFGYHFAVCRSDGDLAAYYARLGFMVITNDEPEIGQAHSLHLAVEKAIVTEAKALLVILADMPFVPTAHFMALVAAYEGSITASTNGQTPMPPAIFPRDNWRDLLATSGDAGARGLLANAKLVAASCEELRDIDVGADLLRPQNQ